VNTRIWRYRLSAWEAEEDAEAAEDEDDGEASEAEEVAFGEDTEWCAPIAGCSTSTDGDEEVSAATWAARRLIMVCSILSGPYSGAKEQNQSVAKPFPKVSALLLLGWRVL
jgi:hypothetical protein